MDNKIISATPDNEQTNNNHIVSNETDIQNGNRKRKLQDTTTNKPGTSTIMKETSNDTKKDLEKEENKRDLKKGKNAVSKYRDVATNTEPISFSDDDEQNMRVEEFPVNKLVEFMNKNRLMTLDIETLANKQNIINEFYEQLKKEYGD